MGIFDKFKIGLNKSSKSLSSGLNDLIFKRKIDESLLNELEDEEEPLALAKIGERTRKVVNANPTIKVLVEGDKSLNYGIIVNLMNVLQLAGATSVGLITEPPK